MARALAPSAQPDRSDERRRDLAEPLEVRLDAIASRERELSGEGPRHDEVAGAKPLAEAFKLRRQPGHGIEGVAEHRIAAPLADLDAVHAHMSHELREIAGLCGRHRRPEHEG